MTGLQYLRQILFLIVVSAFYQIADAQDVTLSNRLIERYQNGNRHLKSTVTGSSPFLWLSPLLHEAKQNWDKLTPEAKTLFGHLSERPKFAGTERKVTYENFVFHYSIDGPPNESVDPTDLDKSGIPDYVETIAHILGDSIYSLYHKTAQFALPPKDDDQTNRAFYDVYISGDKADVLGQGTYGYVAAENIVGDNSNSAQFIETRAATSFIVLRNNYKGFDQPEKVAIGVTASHEYMHAVQYGYSFEIDRWLMEAASSWAEEFAFPGYDDNFQYLTYIFSIPDVALNFAAGEESKKPEYDGHWYGTWLFMQYLTEHTNTSIVRKIFEKCISKSSLNSIDEVLKENWNSDFYKIFLQYILANSLLGVEHEFAPYTYKRASDYFEKISKEKWFRYEGKFQFKGEPITFKSNFEGNNTLMRLSYENFYIQSSTNFRIEFTPSDNTSEVDIALIKYSSENGTEIQPPKYAENTSILEVNDHDLWEYYIPVVVRFDKDVKNTLPVDYVLNLKSAPITNISETKNMQVQIYPNPANDLIFIKTDDPGSEEINIELTDMTGKKVFEKRIRNNSTIDVSKFTPGIYLVKILDLNGKITCRKQTIY